MMTKKAAAAAAVAAAAERKSGAHVPSNCVFFPFSQQRITFIFYETERGCVSVRIWSPE